MRNLERTISKTNAAQLIEKYVALVEEAGAFVGNHTGLRLCQELKREEVGAGPYPCSILP